METPFTNKKTGKQKLFSHWSLRIILGGIILFILVVLFPLRSLFFEGFITGKTLIIVTNENEARPCGGFATAYGVMQIFPPKLELNDIYKLQSDALGNAQFPLTKVSKKLNFWDLGTSNNMKTCSETFKNAYTQITEDEVDNIAFINFKTLENIFGIFRGIEVNGEKVSPETFFTDISKSVADVDRHDEESLRQRKSPMKIIAKQIIKKSILNPFNIPQLTYLIGKGIQSGGVYIPHISPDKAPSISDFAFTEWNLGGGKSSRYLKKNLSINIRETMPNVWDIRTTLKIENIGQYNEPVGQDWQGVFEIQFPEFMNEQIAFLETQVPINSQFEKKWYRKYEGTLPYFGIFSAQGQELFADISISFYGQKTISDASFDTQENTGTFYGPVRDHKAFIWTENKDKTPPFITLHEIIPKGNIQNILSTEKYISRFESSNMIAEIHFNENIVLKNDFSATLRDKNWENQYTDNPILSVAYLFPNKRTLLLGFTQEKKQTNERFALSLQNIEDDVRNSIVLQERTLIDRQ